MRLFLLLTIALSARAAEFRATDYGAKADAKTVNTVALQKAIDAASKSGNGVVVFAPSVYLGEFARRCHRHLRPTRAAPCRPHCASAVGAL